MLDNLILYRSYCWQTSRWIWLELYESKELFEMKDVQLLKYGLFTATGHKYRPVPCAELRHGSSWIQCCCIVNSVIDVGGELYDVCLYSVGHSLSVKLTQTSSLVTTSRTLTCPTCSRVPNICMLMISAISAVLRTSSPSCEIWHCSRSSSASVKTSQLISMAEYSLICCW